MKYICALLFCIQSLFANPSQDVITPSTISDDIIACFAQSIQHPIPNQSNEPASIIFSCHQLHQGYMQLVSRINVEHESSILEEQVLLEIEHEFLSHKIFKAFKERYQNPLRQDAWESTAEPFYILDNFTKCRRENDASGKEYLKCITYIKNEQYRAIVQQSHETKS